MKKIVVLSTFLFFTGILFAQNVTTGGKETLKIKGFVSTTFFGQNQGFVFGNGQNAEFAAPPEYTTNRWFYGGDIRNSRLTMVFNGPELTNNWKLGGVLEFDAFGGFNGAGAFSAEQPTPRLRLAYLDIVHDNLTIRLGQAWTPLFGNVPVSMSHIAFPLGYGSAGDVGWRFPGIYMYYKFASNSSTHVGLDAAVFEGSWSGPGNNVNFGTAGNSGTPQFEVRLNLNSKISEGTVFKAYVVGHIDSKNLAGTNVDSTSTLSGSAAEVGASINSNGFLLQGNIYHGKNIGQQFGQLTQIQSVNKDLSSTGGWAQLGYSFPSGWGIYGFYGMESVSKSEAMAAIGNSARIKNNLFDVMVKYQTGPLGLGVEYLQNKLTYGLNEDTAKGTQVSFSALYKF